jgi:two-component system, NarL family, nitrate/nitrite response regulator NarL
VVPARGAPERALAARRTLGWRQSRPFCVEEPVALSPAQTYTSSVDLVLVEDHLAYRQSFRIALSTLTDYNVVGEAGGAREGCEMIEKRKPDLAIVDFILGDSDGVSLARELRRRRNRTPILILGRIPHPLFVRDAFKAGVRGYALKNEPLANVIEAIERVHTGEIYISPQLKPYLEREDLGRGIGQLSRREREVLCLLVDGRSSKEIARALCVSVRTVDAHRLHINRKLAVRSPAQLARYVADVGLVG